MNRLLPFSGLALLSLACERDDFYSEATFTDNVARAYEECDEGEIRFLSGKHGIQLAFDACGSNKFSDINWSHDGQLLSFHLTHGSHLLDAETMRIESMPTEAPIAGSSWIRDGLLVLPLGPSEEAGDAGPLRLAFYDRTARTLDYAAMPSGYAAPLDLQAAPGEGDRVALTLVGPDGVRRPYAFDRNTGEVARILDFLTQPVERLSLAPEADLLGWSTPESSELMRISTGESLMVFDGVKRAIPHPEGRYVALELDGEPISLFDQRTWAELSPEAQEREMRRKEKWLETLPEWAPREARPPEIQIVDLSKEERYRVTAFYGDHFEWYRPRNYWMSFILWGIEGKQLHRNVAVTDIAERLRMLDKGEEPLGMQRLTLKGEVPSEATKDASTEIPAEQSGGQAEGRGGDRPSTEE